MTNDALIHLRVPAATKGRWIKASRNRGQRLTDWVVEAVEDSLERQSADIEPDPPTPDNAPHDDPHT